MGAIGKPVRPIMVPEPVTAPTFTPMIPMPDFTREPVTAPAKAK